jgi:hypothetical protein
LGARRRRHRVPAGGLHRGDTLLMIAARRSRCRLGASSALLRIRSTRSSPLLEPVRSSVSACSMVRAGPVTGFESPRIVEAASPH